MNNRHFFKKLYAKGIKCKVLFTLLFLGVLFSSFVDKAMAQVGTPWATFKDGTLTLGCSTTLPEGGKDVSAQFKTGASVGDYVGSPLNVEASAVKTVIIQQSFASYEPKALQRMFQGCTKLETIDGIKNINTSIVEDMSNMFRSCKNLKSSL